MNPFPQTLLDQVDSSDPENWKLDQYIKRGGYAAIKKILANKMSPVGNST